MIREIEDRDIEAFYQLERIRAQSVCIDKQVSCIIVNKKGAIVASGVNTVLECNKNCHDKANRICTVRHAEVSTLQTLSMGDIQIGGLTAYTSLFPCKACQEELLPFVDEIVTFGMIHKDWVSGDKLTVFHHMSYMLMKHNGPEKQRFVAMGELAELITSVSDFFARGAEGKAEAEEVLDEIFDAETQIEILKIMVHEKFPEAYNELRRIRDEKTKKLLTKYAKSGVSSYAV